MKSTDWKQFAELIGIAAIVASLVFVGLQLQQEEDVAVSQLSYELNARILEWSSLVSSKSEVWRTGLSGGELDESDQVQFEALAHAHISNQQARWQTRSRLQPGPADHVLIETAQFLYQYPGLYRLWVERRVFRVESGDVDMGPFSRGVDRVLEELKSGEREPVTIDSWIQL